LTPILVTVWAKGDTDAEYIETFRLKVSNVSGAGTYQPQATGYIVDDELVTVNGYVFVDTNRNGYWDGDEVEFDGVTIKVSDSAGNVTNAVTGPGGEYTALVVLGTVKIEIVENTVIEGWELTTDNDSQQEDFDGSVGISPFTPLGYYLPVSFTLPNSADTVGRGGTDDTIFGGPGNDYIDAGWGDDHVVGGHWQTATDSNAPINLGSYDARILAKYVVPTDIDDPQTAPIWEVDDSVGAGTGSVAGNIFVDTDNSSRQDEGLYLSEIVVTLLDCESNIINIMATSTGAYLFEGLYAGTYYVQFSLPNDQQFVEANVGDDLGDSDAELAGATAMMNFASGEAKSNVDAGLEEAGTAPTASSSTVEFADRQFHVSDTDGSVLVTLVRGNATTAEAVAWFATDGSAIESVNYTGLQGVVVFAAGETIATFEMPILNSGLAACDVLDFRLSIRRPTGQPIRGGEATVYIHGEGSGANEDNDTIRGGDDWDIILGDSGNIPAGVIRADLANGQITDRGGLGHDIIYGDDSADYVNGQLGNDFLAGGEGEDFVYGGYGDDRILVELDDDYIYGGHGTDTVYGSSNREFITLDGAPVPMMPHLRWGKAATHDTADSEFFFDSIETVELFGTATDETFTISNWDGELFVFGDDGDDVLHIISDLPSVTLSDATFFQKLFYQVFYGFNVEANVVLTSGPAYHFGEMETVKLSGQAGDNTLDASAYSGDVIFEGGAGNDTLIGGTGNDTFLFDTDNLLGTDTVTGNGGTDTLDFSSTSSAQDVEVNLGTLGSVQMVNGNLSLVLTAEDIEGATGGDGNDELTGNSLDNILTGGPGNDTLIGRDGSETYRYDIDSPWGDDTIIELSGAPGHDTIDFSATTTQSITINLALTAQQTINPSLNLRLTLSGGGIEEVIGGALDDVITGDGNNNTLRGGPGDDTLYGAGGDDFLDGGSGTDLLDGGPGYDSISSKANSSFTLNDTQLIRNGGDVDNLFSIDFAELTGGASNNIFTLTGWSGDVSIDGAGGTDRIIFAADVDMALSSAGSTDVLLINAGTQTIAADNVERWTLSGGVGDNTIDASLYTRAGGYLTLNGNDGNDTILGSINDDIINGGGGDDILSGGRGYDTINGGTGNDTITETGFVSLFVTSSGLLVNYGGAVSETDSLSGVETIIADGGAGNQIFAFSGAPAGVTSITFTGGAGTGDLIGIIWNGVMTITNTTVTLAGAPAIAISGMETLIVLAGSGDDVVDASTFGGVSFLSGGDGDDVLIGGAGNDTLLGGNGNDTLIGRGGNDSLNGGDNEVTTDDGDDTYVFDTDSALGTDTITDDGGEDTLDFSATFTLGHTVNLTLTSNPVNANLTINWLAGTQIENLIGGSQADNFTGDGSANKFTGNGGNDTLNGAGGNDTYYFDVDTALGSDTITDSAGIDTLDFSATSGANLIINLTTVAAQVVHANLTLTLGASVIENVTGGDGHDTITGNASDNVLIGNGGNDTLIGGNGADTLNGGDGNDNLQGQLGNDTYVFNGGIAQGLDTLSDTAGTDTLDFSATFGPGLVFNLGSTAVQTVVPSAPLNLRIQLTSATAFENIIGGSGNDTFTGNSAINTFTGNAGNDTFHGSPAGNDKVSETRDADFEIEDITASQARLTVNRTETDTLNNIHDVTLTGGAGDNTFDASDFGSLANATASFFGLGGDDTFIGGGDVNQVFTGIMNFSGGSGDDTFIFDMSLRSVNTISEGFFLFDDLHDTIIGAGGGLVNLGSAALQTPDAINFPNFTIQFTFAFTVEHTL
jgi:Ca2+-binding RTX toxin-like protein